MIFGIIDVIFIWSLLFTISILFEFISSLRRWLLFLKERTILIKIKTFSNCLLIFLIFWKLSLYFYILRSPCRLTSILLFVLWWVININLKLNKIYLIDKGHININTWNDKFFTLFKYRINILIKSKMFI